MLICRFRSSVRCLWVAALKPSRLGLWAYLANLLAQLNVHLLKTPWKVLFTYHFKVAFNLLLFEIQCIQAKLWNTLDKRSSVSFEANRTQSKLSSQRCSLCWFFKRIIAGHFVSPQIEKPHSGGKWGCWLRHWTSQLDLSGWCCQGRAWCAGPIADDTSHSLRNFSFFYFQVLAKRAHGAQAKTVERFARQAADECTLVLVEKSAEFSYVVFHKLSLRPRIESTLYARLKWPCEAWSLHRSSRAHD